MKSWSIVVVTWNSEEELGPLLASVDEHIGPEVEVVVVDNGSADGTVDVARSYPGLVTVLATGENLGFGQGNNVGVEEATTDVVVMLNPDTYLVDSSLRDLAELARSRRILVGPRMLNADGSVQPSASVMPGSPAAVLNAVVPVGVLPAGLAEFVQPWRTAAMSRVGWLTGACVAARRDLLLELGPFDPRIHLYSEDLDLGLRAADAGITSFIAPDVAQVVHLGDRSSGKAFSDRGLWLSASNRRLVVHERRGELIGWLDFVLEVVGHALGFAYRRLRRDDASYYVAWLRNIRRLVRRPTFAPASSTEPAS